MKFEYLIFNLIIFLSPLLSFFIYPKIIYPFNLISILSITISSLIFIFHDILVTNRWWKFNEKYIINKIKILNLPIEEVLFFFIVGFSCLTLWINLRLLELKLNLNFYLLYFFIFIYYLYIFLKFKKPYTKIVTSFYLFLITLDLILKTKLILNNLFFIFLLIFFLLTLIFNLYLTKRPVVIYNQTFLSGKKILTIPIEDFLYGINFIYLLVIIYEFLLRLSIF
ncbi:MAG: hypothetical protein KatS3mg092_0550 [Patescibacteria group bacterium]|nr:MAG: hypothetical protein KatS3mg092_0550 [Patescibacteria group bacterium]